MSLSNFLRLLADDMYIDLYVDGVPSLFCSVPDAMKTVAIDGRGELIIVEKSIEIYEQNIGYAGVHRKCLRVEVRKRTE